MGTNERWRVHGCLGAKRWSPTTGLLDAIGRGPVATVVSISMAHNPFRPRDAVPVGGPTSGASAPSLARLCAAASRTLCQMDLSHTRLPEGLLDAMLAALERNSTSHAQTDRYGCQSGACGSDRAQAYVCAHCCTLSGLGVFVLCECLHLCQCMCLRLCLCIYVCLRLSLHLGHCLC
jgi:hypothetical protein